MRPGSPTPPTDGPAPREIALVAVVAGLVALTVLVPGLGGHGLWTEGELAVLARVRAALGEPLHGLERSPWLPEALRTVSARALGPTDLAVRLPSALAVAGLVALVAGEARRRFDSRVGAGLAAAIALCTPWALASGRTALGAPVAELTVALAVVLGLRGLGGLDDEQPRRPAVLRLTAAALMTAAAVASCGLFLGASVPLAAIALGDATDGPPPPHAKVRQRVRAGVGVAAVLAAMVAAWLALGQDNGYIPLLGAARPLSLIDQPSARPFTAWLEQMGMGLFPWLGLVLVGALLPEARVRFAAVWLVVALVATSAWSLRYGTIGVGVVVPASLCAAAGARFLLSPDAARTHRRLAFTLAALAILVIGKDAQRWPARVWLPVAELGAVDFPERLAPAGTETEGEGPEVAEVIHRWSRFSLAILALAFFVSARSRTPEDPRDVAWSWRDAVPDQLPHALLVAYCTTQAVVGAQRVAPGLDAQLSLRPPLDRWARLVEAGAAPPSLGIHRVDDDAVRWYAGAHLDRLEQLEPLASRRDIFEWLDRETPSMALLPAAEFPPVFSRQRLKEAPLYVLDRRAEHTWLVANFLPEGARDQNPILDVLADAPPGTGRPTYVRFKHYVELVEWDLIGDPRRGGEVELVVTFHVLRPLPSSTQLWGRLKMDRISRVNDEPQVLTDGVYPPNNWRRGDYVTHRHRFEIPRFEAFPGPHEVLIGLRRNQYDNVEISLPEGKRGEHGVRVIGNKRGFARVGEVTVR